jgi:hypothetical protein
MSTFTCMRMNNFFVIHEFATSSRVCPKKEYANDSCPKRARSVSADSGALEYVRGIRCFSSINSDTLAKFQAPHHDAPTNGNRTHVRKQNVSHKSLTELMSDTGLQVSATQPTGSTESIMESVSECESPKDNLPRPGVESNPSLRGHRASIEDLNLERAAQILDSRNRERLEKRRSLEADARDSWFTLANGERHHLKPTLRSERADEVRRIQEAQILEVESSRRRAIDEVENDRRELERAAQQLEAELARSTEEKLMRRTSFRQEVATLKKKAEEFREMEEKRQQSELLKMKEYNRIVDQRQAVELTKRKESQVKRSQASALISISIESETQRLNKLAEIRNHIYAVEQESLARQNERDRKEKNLQFRESFEQSRRQEAEDRSKMEELKRSEKLRDRAQVDEIFRREKSEKEATERARLDRQRALKTDLDTLVASKRVS